MIEGVDAAAALLEYRGVARELVARLKYRNQRAVIDWLARGMAPLVPADADALTWAPANRGHVRERGFDHAELLARAVARLAGRPLQRLFRRADDAPLTGRTAAERGRALRLDVVAPAPARLVVVDDVLPSGATVRAAASAARGAGATRVYGLFAAYTPPPGLGPLTR